MYKKNNMPVYESFIGHKIYYSDYFVGTNHMNQ